MKNKVYFASGTSKWWIIAGILFLLYPTSSIVSFFIREIANFLFTHNIISSYPYPSSASMAYLVSTILSILASMFLALLLGIGCFIHKKTTIFLGISFVLFALFSELSSISTLAYTIWTYSRIDIFSYMQLSGIIGLFVRNTVIYSLDFIAFIAFLLIAFFIFSKFQKKALGIIAAIILIFHTIVLFLYQIIIIFGSLGSDFNYLIWGTMFPFFFSFIAVLAILIPCLIIVFLAGKIEKNIEPIEE